MKIKGSFGMGLLICLLITFISGAGQTLVTPEHYEKLKREARETEKKDEKPNRQSQEVPSQIQDHHPAKARSDQGEPVKK